MRKTALGALLIGLLFLANPLAAKETYSLRLYNVDDVLSAYITNSSYTAQLISQTFFLGDSGEVDISTYVKPGANDIFLQPYNDPLGWTYSYEFFVNGYVYEAGGCGLANVYGCENNDYTTGNVWSHDILFDTGALRSAAVPEASSVTLFAGALSVLLCAWYARSRKLAFQILF